MNERTKNDLIIYRLKRSKETLNEVKTLLKLKYYNTAINRLYYSAFYSVLALFLKYNINAKTHAGIRQKFGQEFIIKALISKESGKLYSELHDKRQKGDYTDFFDFTEEDVKSLLEPTRILISEIETIINPKNLQKK